MTRKGLHELVDLTPHCDEATPVARGTIYAAHIEAGDGDFIAASFAFNRSAYHGDETPLTVAQYLMFCDGGPAALEAA